MTVHFKYRGVAFIYALAGVCSQNFLCVGGGGGGVRVPQ